MTWVHEQKKKWKWIYFDFIELFKITEFAYFLLSFKILIQKEWKVTNAYLYCWRFLQVIVDKAQGKKQIHDLYEISSDLWQWSMNINIINDLKKKSYAHFTRPLIFCTQGTLPQTSRGQGPGLSCSWSPSITRMARSTTSSRQTCSTWRTCSRCVTAQLVASAIYTQKYLVQKVKPQNLIEQDICTEKKT